jgi:hypothetical protein
MQMMVTLHFFVVVYGTFKGEWEGGCSEVLYYMHWDFQSLCLYYNLTLALVTCNTCRCSELNLCSHYTCKMQLWHEYLEILYATRDVTLRLKSSSNHAFQRDWLCCASSSLSALCRGQIQNVRKVGHLLFQIISPRFPGGFQRNYQGYGPHRPILY